MPARSALLELEAHLERCSTTLTSCEPADRSCAEVGIAGAYAAADLAPPRSIIWCDNPLQIARQIASAPVSHRVGCSVKGRIFEQVRDRLATLAEIFWKEVLIAANKPSNLTAADGAITRWEKNKEVSAGASRVVLADADDVLSRVETRIRHAWRRCHGLPCLIGDGGFNEVAIGPHDFLPLKCVPVSAKRFELGRAARPIPCRACGRSATTAPGRVVPYEHVCWVSRASGRGACRSASAATLRRWPRLAIPRWLVCLRLEGREAFRLDDRNTGPTPRQPSTASSIRRFAIA